MMLIPILIHGEIVRLRRYYLVHHLPQTWYICVAAAQINLKACCGALLCMPMDEL